MDNNDYLKSINSKIKYEKIKNNIIGSIGSIAICLIVFLSSKNINEDVLFNQFYESISYYEWEIVDKVSDHDIYEYLIDNTCIEDYDSFLDEQLIEIINQINFGG